MLKLLRLSNSIYVGCASKQYSNMQVLHHIAINRGYQLNCILDNVKHYSTQEQEVIIKDNTPQMVKTTINEVIADHPDLEQKLKLLLLEMEVMRQENLNVPSETFMKKDYWVELLRLGTRTARKRYLTYLFKLEKRKENIAVKKEQKRLEREENPLQSDENGHLTYSLSQNNILLRIYDTTINHFYNYKLIQAMMFGQQLVVDCGYHTAMTKRENVNCAKQLMLLFSENRMHDDPFDLHFCNFDRSTILTKALHKNIITMYEPWFPLNLHECNYTDVFPKEKLVYLTPHCREEMLEYDHDAIYIIGGIVDKSSNEPLSLAKAKREGLKMRKLPLDRYLQWGAGSGKNLPLNHMIAVLLDLKRTGDWKFALRHVPRRKLVDEEDMYPNINNSRTLAYDTDKGKNYQTNVRTRKHIKMSDNFAKNLAADDIRRKFNVKNIMSK